MAVLIAVLMGVGGGTMVWAAEQTADAGPGGRVWVEQLAVCIAECDHDSCLGDCVAEAYETALTARLRAAALRRGENPDDVRASAKDLARGVEVFNEDAPGNGEPATPDDGDDDDRGMGCAFTPGANGDVNGDGVINLDDLLCILSYIAGEKAPCPPSAMDVSPCGAGDGFTNMDDLLMVLDAVAGLYDCCVPVR